MLRAVPSVPPLLTVLLIDDDPFEREALGRLLNGAETELCLMEARGPAEARRQLARRRVDVVLLDLHLGGAEPYDGLALVADCRRLAPGAAVVALSALDEAPAVEEALGAAVDDFVSKDRARDELWRVILGAWGRRAASLDEATARRPGTGAAGRTLMEVARRIPALLRSAVRGVHLKGETGTGKEVAAGLFRDLAGEAPFVSVNCAAIPAGLVESALFGAARGAFTGATADRTGYLEAASGGWLFLDEVACLGAAAQAALLRALESQEIVRVGETAPRRVAIRVLSATNEELAELVRTGRFRLDLWQRLTEVEIALPPLRERLDEVDELLDHLLATLPGGPYRLTAAARRLLASQPWAEGNVRQLRNCLRAMTERPVGGLLTPQSIPEQYRRQTRRERVAAGAGAAGAPSAPAPAGQLQAGAASAPAPSGLFLPLPPDFGASPAAYARLTDRLLIESVKTLGRRHGPLGLRGLAQQLGTSKSSLARRLQAAVASGVATREELAPAVRAFVGPSRPSGRARSVPTGTSRG